MDSYDILNVTKDATDKEIEIAYEDLKQKYDPSFNTSIHAYKKYREILKAYENIKDEQRRKMYDLKEYQTKEDNEVVHYLLYDFEQEKDVNTNKDIDYSKVEVYEADEYKDIEIIVKISYLYKLLNLKYDLQYFRKVKCQDCSTFSICGTCDGKKVVEYRNHLVWCPKCGGTGKLSSNCKNCGDSGYHQKKEVISFYVDSDVKEFKGYGDEYINNLNSNLKITFDFYDRENIHVVGDTIEVNYYLNKEETFKGIDSHYFTESGAFKLEIPGFVENKSKKEINFNNKKIIYTFYNDEYDGDNRVWYLFINKSYKNKYLFFNADYSFCSLEETIDCNKMIKCDSNKILVEGKGEEGKYGGKNGDLIINVEFNNDNDIFYTDKVKIVETSKLFNLLGGKKEGLYHYGFKGVNSLIRREDVYYLLKGQNKEKCKLKNYFLFKALSFILWSIIPLLMIIIPYSKGMFVSLIVILIGYLILVNILMEVEA